MSVEDQPLIDDQPAKRVWERPELTRFEAAQAELGGGALLDASDFS